MTNPTAKQLTKMLNTAGLYRGFTLHKSGFELFVEDGTTGRAHKDKTSRVIRRAKAAMKQARVDWAGYYTAYGSLVISCGVHAASKQRMISRSLELEQFGVVAQ